jgi:hypothetical protein
MLAVCVYETEAVPSSAIRGFRNFGLQEEETGDDFEMRLMLPTLLIDSDLVVQN